MIVTIRTKEDIKDLVEMLEKRIGNVKGKETWIIYIREAPEELPEESD